MTKKILFAVTALFMFFGYAAAQDEPKGKLNVYVDYFNRTNNTPFIWAEALRNAVIEGIQKTNRVNIIDVDNQEALSIEKSRREQENAVAGDDMDRMKVMVEEGANLILNGLVNDISVKKLVGDKGNVSYLASISYTLKVIDPSNGTTVYTETFKIPGNLGLIPNPMVYGDTEDEAVHKLFGNIPGIPSIQGQMKKFVDKAFPIIGTVADLDKTKGSEVQTLYINLGEINGMAKGAKLSVFLKKIVAGKEAFRNIGEIEVEAVEGDELSLCKVKKGGKEIYEAFQAGQELRVKSAAK